MFKKPKKKVNRAIIYLYIFRIFILRTPYPLYLILLHFISEFISHRSRTINCVSLSHFLFFFYFFSKIEAYIFRSPYLIQETFPMSSWCDTCFCLLYTFTLIARCVGCREKKDLNIQLVSLTLVGATMPHDIASLLLSYSGRTSNSKF